MKPLPVGADLVGGEDAIQGESEGQPVAQAENAGEESQIEAE